MRILSKPVGKIFEFGEGEDAYTVAFSQLTEGDYIELADLESEFEIRYAQTGQFEGVRRRRNRRRIERRAAYRAMTACDLKWYVPDDEEDPKELNGKPVFRVQGGRVSKGMSEVEFNEAWDALPADVSDNIVREALLKVNPTLDPYGNAGE